MVVCTSETIEDNRFTLQFQKIFQTECGSPSVRVGTTLSASLQLSHPSLVILA